jgi:flagellar protein FlgJ
MNVEALTSSSSAQASFLAAQASGSAAAPSAAQIQNDRNLLEQSKVTKGKTSAPRAATPAEIKKAASQFEAIILRQLLAPSIEPVMSGSMGGGKDSGGGVYGYMLTDVLATSLSQGGGLGWGRLLEKQLSSTRPGADINSSTILKHPTKTSPL